MIPKTIILKVEEEREPIHRLARKCASITLSGPWLEKAGFLPNDSAAVAIYNNALIIRPVKKDTDE